MRNSQRILGVTDFVNAFRGYLDHLQTLSRSSLELRYASGSIVHAAVNQNGLALRWASKELKGDAEIVRNAVKQNGMALKFNKI